MALGFRTAKRWITKKVTPDFTNQLDLFSEAVPETPVAADPQRRSLAAQPRPQPQQLTLVAWEPSPLEDDARTPAAQTAAGNTGARGGALYPAPVQTDITAPGEISQGTEPGDRPLPVVGKVFDIEPEAKPSRDFRIITAHRIGQSSLHEKSRDNIAAIRLLKTLEAENRDATEDEKPVLALYAGWGAILCFQSRLR